MTKTKLVTHRQQSTKIGSKRNIGSGSNGDEDDKGNNDDGGGENGNDKDNGGNDNGPWRWPEGNGRRQWQHGVGQVSGGRRRLKWE
jgi:hypothetical protein